MAAQFLIFLEKWVETFPEYRDDDVLPHNAKVNSSYILLASHMLDNISLTSPTR